MRIVKSINFDWLYNNNFKEEQIKDKHHADIIKVNIPHTNIELPYNNFDEKLYAFKSCYKKNINILDKYKEKDVFLNFEGVGNYAKVYLNEKLIGEHKGGYTPFKIKLNDELKFGQDNFITVVVDSTERDDIPPFGHVVDYLTYGGIYREVYLSILEKTHIENIFIKTNNALEDKKELDIDLKLSRVEKDLTVECEILDINNNVIKVFKREVPESKEINIKENIEDVSLWSLENPNLYKLKVCLNNKVKNLDQVIERFGFRKTEFKKDGFYLNNQRIKIRGLNRHQSFSNVGYAMPKSMQEKDAEILKYELGVNLVRTSHYPQSKHFLNRCDEIGLLVFTEIPGWQHISSKREWRNIVIKNVEEMIIRDRNHPSIVIWGVRINESQDCDELYLETNKLAHKLDPTRQTAGVRNFAGSNLLEDVYTYNDFIHNGNNIPLENESKITKRKDIPYLVTEHNGHMYPTKRFDHEEKRVEHALRHARVLNHMYGSDNISGVIGWCMFDYNTHKDFGSGDKICYHGVMDMFRIPKIAAYVYSSQQDETPVIEISSSMDIGEHPGSMLGSIYIFTNCDYIKLYKNEKYIGDYYPDKKEFKNLPHPPIIIEDLIGSQIKDNERFSEKDADRIKDILLAGTKYGLDLPVKYKIKMGYLMLKTGLNMDEGINLYSKYIGNWGEKQIEYKFEGYKNNEIVKTIIKKSVTKPKLKIKVDNTNLIEDESYDVTRVVIEAVCENNNLLPYANDVINLETEGPIAIIGEKSISLIGGARGVYIKTIGESGEATLNIKAAHLGEYKLRFKIKKIETES